MRLARLSALLKGYVRNLESRNQRPRHAAILHVHAPARVGIEDLDAVERRLPVRPPQIDALGESGCATMPNPPEAPDVFDDVAAVAAERIRRCGQSDGDVVTVRCADLHRVQAQDAGSVRRGIRLAGGVAMVGQDDELQPGPSRRCGNLVGRASPVRSFGVDVEGAGHGAVRLVLK